MNYKDKIEEIIDELEDRCYRHADLVNKGSWGEFKSSALVKLLTLYEQAQRDAVEDWMDYLFKEHGEWVELDEARYKNALGQYLNQTKEGKNE